CSIFPLISLPPPCSPLFPYTTLFRSLLIEACKSAGIEIPSFCYYPGLSLQAACRMCVVRIEKMPKLQTACTVPITDGMVVTNERDRKSTRLNSSHLGISYAVFCLKKK